MQEQLSTSMSLLAAASITLAMAIMPRQWCGKCIQSGARATAASS